MTLRQKIAWLNELRRKAQEASGWAQVDVRLSPDGESLLLLPPGHALNRLPRPRSGLRSGRPRTTGARRKSSSRGSPDDEPGLPGGIRRVGAWSKGPGAS